MNIEPHSKKLALYLIAFFFLVLASYFMYGHSTELSSSNKIKDVSSEQVALSKKANEMISYVHPDTIFSGSFFDTSFSKDFKDAYANYQKGQIISAVGVNTGEDREYTKKAILAFANLYNSENISKKERAYALILINVMYIGTTWDDTFMKDTVYTVSPFKEIFDSRLQRLSKKYPNLSTTKDQFSVYNQTSLLGATSQQTMSDINAISYELFPVGYSLMRSKMNSLVANQRIYTMLSTYKGLSPIDMYKKYIAEEIGKDNLLSYKKELDTLEKENKLELGADAFKHEIYVMRTISLWDPLSAVTTDQAERLKYQQNMKSDWQKAIAMDSLNKTPTGVSSHPMLKLYYMAFLVDYGVTKKINSSLDTTTQESYKSEAVSTVQALMSENSASFRNLLKKGETYSHRPKELAASAEYYGGSPYYQLRALSMTNDGIKQYLIKNGWSY